MEPQNWAKNLPREKGEEINRTYTATDLNLSDFVANNFIISQKPVKHYMPQRTAERTEDKTFPIEERLIKHTPRCYLGREPWSPVLTDLDLPSA